MTVSVGQGAVFQGLRVVPMQVLTRMFPEANECFLFVRGDLETLKFQGDIPSSIFSLWVVRFLPVVPVQTEKLRIFRTIFWVSLRDK